MKIKTWLPIALALVLGVFAAVLARSAMSARRAAAGPMVKLVVAKRPVAPGEALAATDLDVLTIAGATVPEGARIRPEELVGRTVSAQMVKGQPVLESMLAPEGTPAGLQALVPPGMRAMTIEVNEFSSVGGMITPGAHVDVIGTMPVDGHGENMTRTIAQNVLVKAVGHMTGRVNEKGEEEKAAKSVTLLVTAKQAESVQLASLSGRPWLTLRGGNDGAIASLAGTTFAELRSAYPSIARDVLSALKSAKPLVQPANAQVSLAAPATQPAMAQPMNWSAPRAVHTIRNTVETTVSVTPARATNEAVTGATIEP